MSDWRMEKVIDLQRAGILLVEDGNHGEYRPRPDEFVDQGVAFIRAADINDGQILFNSASKIKEVARERITKGIGAPGDVLLSHKGTVGKLALVPEDAPPFVCSPQTTFWRTLDSDVLERRYLYAFMRSPLFRVQLSTRASETDMAPYVSLTSQRDLTVAIPPIGYQRTIAHILGTLDDKIELNRRMNETLEAMARAIFKSWFVDFDPVRAKMSGEPPESICRRLGLTPELLDLFPDRLQESQLGEIPEGWEVKAIYDLAHYINGLAFRTNGFSQERLGSPVIKIGELKYGITRQTKFTENSFDSKYQITAGDLLFSWSGSPDTSIDTFVWTGQDGWLNQHIFKIEFIRLDEKYFVYFLLRHFKPVFIEISRDKQTTGLGHVTVQDLKRLKTTVPPRKAIQVFNSIAGPIYERIYSGSIENQIIAGLRDSLLPRLLSGELRAGKTDADNRHRRGESCIRPDIRPESNDQSGEHKRANTRIAPTITGELREREI